MLPAPTNRPRSTSTQRTYLLTTLGSTGDVNPIVGLGQMLQARGRRTILIANPHYEAQIKDSGLEFIPLGTEQDYLEMIQNPDLWHPLRGFEVIAKGGILPALRPLYEILSGFDPNSTLLINGGLLFSGGIAHEKLGLSYITLHLQPSLFRSAYRPSQYGNTTLPDWLPSPLMRLYYALIDRFFIDRILAPGINALRAELDLPQQKHFLGPHVHSPQKSLGLFPPWFAPPQPDWPPQTVLTGFPGFDAADQVDVEAALESFLAAGEPPIVFTPGTGMQHAGAFFQASIAAAQALGRRALLLTRHRRHLPPDLPPGVAYFDYIPFSRVLPRVAAIAHHGGIGTVQQALAAGIPQLVMPLSHDQPDNAARLKRLGVSATLYPAQYRAATVQRALADLLGSPQVAARCQELAASVDFQAARIATVETIENHP